MYGTIAKLRVKAGHIGGLELVVTGTKPPGALAVYFYRMDSDPNEAWLVAAFESKEAYWANAKSPEQNQRYLEMMTYLETEPEWHDGEIMFSKVFDR